jgi:C-terminal processing protease CtpA/Prc
MTSLECRQTLSTCNESAITAASGLTKQPNMRLTRRNAAALLLSLALGLASSLSLAQQAGGTIGFSLHVQADGFFSPKVVKALVQSVEPGSQAQAAGLAPGDELIRVEGIAVPGAEASVLRPHMQFVPGKPKKLAFRRPGGQEYEATLVKQ